MENKYIKGQVVYALVKPSEKLLIRRYVDRVYFCKIQSDLNIKEKVFFERELTSESA
jgi:hypothetical protein